MKQQPHQPSLSISAPDDRDPAASLWAGLGWISYFLSADFLAMRFSHFPGSPYLLGPSYNWLRVILASPLEARACLQNRPGLLGCLQNGLCVYV
ncbi:hypothetical protein ACLOJK_003522 [Asimina triloba]